MTTQSDNRALISEYRELCGSEKLDGLPKVTQLGLTSQSLTDMGIGFLFFIEKFFIGGCQDGSVGTTLEP